MQVFDAIRTRLIVREFKPDAAPAENMSTLHSLGLNSVKGGKSLKIGVAAKRNRAGCAFEYPRAIFRLAQ